MNIFEGDVAHVEPQEEVGVEEAVVVVEVKLVEECIPGEVGEVQVVNKVDKHHHRVVLQEGVFLEHHTQVQAGVDPAGARIN